MPPERPRLIDHLKGLGLSNRDARAALSTGKVWLNDLPTRDGGQQVDPKSVRLWREAPRIRVGSDVVIVWRDDEVAVAWKPPGMLSVPAPKRRETNVLNQVRRVCGAALPVHRLDEGTSGLMLVALTEATQDKLKHAIEQRAVERRYLALVRGTPTRTKQRIENFLVRNRGDGKRGSGASEEPGARRAVTHLEVLDSKRGISLVGARLETGRTHQIRIHCAELGHPLLGDGLYGGRGVASMAPRLALHACRLSFPHPTSRREHTFDAPLADDLAMLWRRLSVESAPRPTRRRKRR